MSLAKRIYLKPQEDIDNFLRQLRDKLLDPRNECTVQIKHREAFFEMSFLDKAECERGAQIIIDVKQRWEY